MTNNNPNFIGSFQIETNLCDKIIDFFNKNKGLQSKGEVINGVDETKKKSVDIAVNPKDLYKPDYQNLRIYFDHLFNCYTEYRAQWPFLNEVFEKVDIGSFNIQKYSPGGHFNKLHSERTSIKTLHRLFAFMTYLNDDFEDGETFFEHYSLSVKPKKGKTLIWPAEWTHAHKGNVVNNGSKYIITGWLNIAI
ncbi:MAG: 2OG-Fe(II) oxygenase [Methylophilaceae bacterium]